MMPRRIPDFDSPKLAMPLWREKPDYLHGDRVWIKRLAKEKVTRNQLLIAIARLSA
jgi:hypothetical protein